MSTLATKQETVNLALNADCPYSFLLRWIGRHVLDQQYTLGDNASGDLTLLLTAIQVSSSCKSQGECSSETV